MQLRFAVTGGGGSEWPCGTFRRLTAGDDHRTERRQAPAAVRCSTKHRNPVRGSCCVVKEERWKITEGTLGFHEMSFKSSIYQNSSY